MSNSSFSSLVLESSRSVRKLGYWSALGSTVFSIEFAAAAIASCLAPLPSWDGIESFAEAFRTMHILPGAFALFLIPCLVALMATIYHVSSEDRRLYGLLGLVFSLVYASLLGVNYAVQLVVLRPNLLRGETEGMALFALTNPFSVFWDLELFGYGFMMLSLITAAFVFARIGLEGWVRKLFLLNGPVNILATVAFAVFLNPVIVFVSLPVWSILFPVSAGMLFAVFND